MNPRALIALLLGTASLHAQQSATWNTLTARPSVLVLQREGIATRPANSTANLTSAAITGIPSGTGVRVRALLTPPTTGQYTLHISGANAATLWLSPDASRFSKQPVAALYETTTAQQWTKFPSQASAPIALQAATAYYLEAQVMASAAGGHIALGWKTPGSTTITLIPIQHLTTLPQDPADLDDNHLPDSWQENTGLNQSTHPAAKSEHGDPDNDGITNLDEYHLQSNPLAKEARADGITRDTWHGVSGGLVTDLTHNSRLRFLSYPGLTEHIPTIDAPALGSNIGVRYRGFLVAPATGAYRLWIAGNDKCELWFADGTVKHPATQSPLTNRFGKQLLAHNTSPIDHFPSAYQGFDRLASQRTRLVHLIAGQHYYLEILHKKGGGTPSHVAVAWQPPGQPRAIIPATALLADVPDNLDADADFLPDDWETATTLSPTDNGLISNKQGQYGDFDNDTLTNLQEFQNGTHPKSADTDNDGLSDSQEIHYLRTNPLVSNNLAPVTVATPAPHAYTTATGGWTHNPNGTLSAWDRRGEITYNFEITTPGVHEIILTGAAIGNIRATERLPILFTLDTAGPLTRTELVSANFGGQGTARAITPLLRAGTHTLTILHDNDRTARRLRIDSIAIQRLGGQDLNQNNLPDWVEQNAAAQNTLTRIPLQSRTSPLSIEGTTQSLATATVEGSVGVPPASTEPQQYPLTPSINQTFFTNIPLSETAPTTLTTSFLGGAITQTHSIEWIETNLLELHGTTLHIRQHDALRLTAHIEGTPGTFILQGSAGVPPASTQPQPSTQPLTTTFPTPGLHTLTATFTPVEGPVQTATITLHVHTADFGPALSLRTYNPRTWTPPVLHALHQIEADERINLLETTASSGPRAFSATVYEAANRHIIARLPANIEGAPSAILARGTAHGFRLAYLNETGDAQIVHRYDDGTWLMSGTLIVQNLPADILIRLRTEHQGTVFPDGSKIRWLTAADFDANGIATIYYEWSGTGSPKLCNHLTLHIAP
jgi:hypothetical protein